MEGSTWWGASVLELFVTVWMGFGIGAFAFLIVTRLVHGLFLLIIDPLFGRNGRANSPRVPRPASRIGFAGLAQLVAVAARESPGRPSTR